MHSLRQAALGASGLTGSDDGRIRMRSDMTIPYIHSRITHMKWCGYCRIFQSNDSFSNAQRMASNNTLRFCTAWSNVAKRAACTTASAEVGDAELRRIAKIMKVTITDLPDAPQARRKERAAASSSEAVASSSEPVSEDDVVNDDDDDGEEDVDEDEEDAPPPSKKQKGKAKAPAMSKRMTDMELEEWMLQGLPKTTEYDNNRTDSTTERDFKSELFNYEKFPSDGDMDWQLALDDVSARMCALHALHLF
jgi:hypothetical protein